jgi:hypothetical protein
MAHDPEQKKYFEAAFEKMPPMLTYWRHVKSGNVYVVVGGGVVDMTLEPSVIYTEFAATTFSTYPNASEMASTWVRSISEFMDGRFVQLSTKEVLSL